jgi:hypothetical protein
LNPFENISEKVVTRESLQPYMSNSNFRISEDCEVLDAMRLPGRILEKWDKPLLGC